ncbi:MAG: radical SAM protein, partial [Verrucomicrobiota bacterium]|nr:radical SAM protein [Verrucomicrobiota bacterium]
MPLVYLTRADIEKIFVPSLLADLDNLKICGNYGDGASAPDAIDSFRFLKSRKATLQIKLHSNGGLRDSDWWRQLAKTIDLCVFGIDGLEDTNHLYRRGVSWSKLMQNVEAFIEAGGTAEWQYLIFKHNEHQVEEARALAASLGFKEFVTKRTHRFFKKGA